MNRRSSPSLIEQLQRVGGSAPASDPDVGEVLRRLDASRALSGPELERHIADCELLWKRAYDRFQDHHNPSDRDEALVWLHRMNEAILMRSPGTQAQRHAAFERRLAAGVDRALSASVRGGLA